jgi:gamma-D-glutamyl-L-lysine dipeptidyl-peptidase
MRCGVDVAPVRAQPRDAAEQMTQLVRGEPVRVEERRNGWSRIVTAYDYGGWVRAPALESGEGSLPAAGEPEPLEAARTFLGAPYEWGGMTAAGIDCSGLVHMAFRASGRLVPRDSWQQEVAGTPIAPGSELLGDVVVYGEPERADHVAFWLGERRILHATARDGLGVVEEDEPADLVARRRGVIRLVAG